MTTEKPTKRALVELRLMLFAAAQRLEGHDLAELKRLVREVSQVLEIDSEPRVAAAAAAESTANEADQRARVRRKLLDLAQRMLDNRDVAETCAAVNGYLALLAIDEAPRQEISHTANAVAVPGEG